VRPSVHVIALVPALLVAVAASPAYAERPTPLQMKSAKQHFKHGRDLQRAHAYEDAVAEYLAAYRLAPRPELLYNIAQCYRLGGDGLDAIDYYLRFLEEAPDDPAAAEARAHIAALRSTFAPAPASAKVTPPPATPQPIVRSQQPWPKATTEKHDDPTDVDPRPTGAKAQELATGEASGDLLDASTDGPRDPVDGPMVSTTHPLRWIGVGGVVSGAALVGAGAYYGWRAASAAGELEDASGVWTPELAARERRARGDEQRMLYLAGGGGALLLLGGALWWWSDREPSAVHAQPLLGAQHAGLAVYGSF
jgi:tetratricopeptide (TPR) repeat protein